MSYLCPHENEVYFLEEASKRILNIYFEDDAVDRVDRKATFIYPAVPGRIEIRMQEEPGYDMLQSTLKNFSIEGTGWESAIISRFVKGGMKEAVEHAVNNTIQPVIYGTLSNPDLPPYLEAAVAEGVVQDTEVVPEDDPSFADAGGDDISLDEN